MRARGVIGVASLLLAALAGCALWRSAPPPNVSWTLVAFPGAGPLPNAHVSPRGRATMIAGGCVAPDTITFIVRRLCAAADDTVRESRERLLIFADWTAAGRRPDILRAALSRPETRARMASESAALAAEQGYTGLLLDLRALGPRDVDALVSLAAAVRDSADAKGVTPVGIVVPVADTAAYPGRLLGAATDFIAPRLELESAAPAPPTPRHRIRRLVGARAAETGAHRIMLLIPLDGFVWPDGEPRRRVSFDEAVATARDWNVDLVRDESSATLRARSRGRGEIWVNDAVLLAGLVRDARRLGIRRFGLYGVAGADPAVWDVVSAISGQMTIRSR